MKILYVVTQGEGGGAQKYVLELAQAFGGEIATGTESDNLALEAEDLGLRVHRLFHLRRAINPLEDLIAFYDLAQLVRTTAPDIVHANSSKAGFLCSFLKILFPKIKIIFTAHGFVFNEPGPQWKKKLYISLEKFASRYRNYIIAVSENDKKAALDNHIIAPEKISVIHNGIGEITLLNKTSARQYMGLPLDKVVVGSIANLYPSKAIDVFIEAAALVSPQFAQYLCFAVVGEGNLRRRLERLIASKNLQKYFKLVGHKELASHYLRGFDIFVLPSRKEGFPFVLLEAMAAGLPIVATDVGGNKEAVGDAAVVIPPDNPKVLATTIEKLIFSKAPEGGTEKLAALSQAAIVRSEQFTVAKMAEETKRIYEYISSQL